MGNYMIWWKYIWEHCGAEAVTASLLFQDRTDDITAPVSHVDVLPSVIPLSSFKTWWMMFTFAFCDMVHHDVLRTPAKVYSSGHQSLLNHLSSTQDDGWLWPNEYTENLPILVWKLQSQKEKRCVFVCVCDLCTHTQYKQGCYWGSRFFQRYINGSVDKACCLRCIGTLVALWKWVD